MSCKVLSKGFYTLQHIYSTFSCHHADSFQPSRQGGSSNIDPILILYDSLHRDCSDFLNLKFALNSAR